MVVWGNPALNVLSRSTFSGIYRDDEARPGNSQRPIMANVVTVNTYLSSGRYWLAWATGGTLSSGPWAPAITFNGLAMTGNGLQFFDRQWRPAADDPAASQQGFPFIITGFGLSVSSLPTLALQVNQAAFPPGNTMILTGTMSPGSLPVPVDLYVVLRIPDGRLFSLHPDGSLVSGIRPAATGLITPSFTGEILRHTFTGTEPVGSYTWSAATTQSGTLTVFGTVDQHTVTVGPVVVE